jgi:predicted enzyme related to lactoylglutathione lyase
MAGEQLTWETNMDKVVHFEIPFDDKKRAMKFYGDAFGWKLTDMAEMSYVMAETVATNEKRRPTEPGAINGGLFPRPKEAPHPVIYVGVASIDETLKKAQAAGGKVVTPKTPIPGMGAYARVSDPEGNVVGLFEGA